MLVLVSSGARAQNDVDMEFEIEEAPEDDVDLAFEVEDVGDEDQGEGPPDDARPAGGFASKLLERLRDARVQATGELGLYYQEQAFAGGQASTAANYHFSDTRLALRLGLDADTRVMGKLRAGLATWFVTSAGAASEDAPAGSVRGFRLMTTASVQVTPAVSAGAQLGYDLHLRGADTTTFPAEREQSFVLGVTGHYQHEDTPYSGDLVIDFLLAPALAQTLGLQDGADASGSGWQLALTGRYRFLPRLDFTASFEVTRTTFDFTGPSERDALTTSGQRSSARNLVLLGAAWTF